MDDDVLLLQENLASSESSYAQLLELAKVKQQHLIHNDVASLREDLGQEEALVEEIARLEGDRRRIHSRCAEALGLDSATRLESLSARDLFQSEVLRV